MKIQTLKFAEGKENNNVYITSRGKYLKDLPRGVVYMDNNKSHVEELEGLKKKHPRYFENGTLILKVEKEINVKGNTVKKTETIVPDNVGGK